MTYGRWDSHGANFDLVRDHGSKLDQGFSALVEDLERLYMLNDTTVIAWGEFGRTPRINNGQPGIPIPGSDHWGDAISVMMAGGGLKPGIVVGSTNDKAEHPMDRPLKPGDILATIYHEMGIDPSTTFNDYAGRPQAVLPQGEAIAELI